MVSLMFTRFSIFTLINIGFLYLGCYIIKKYIRQFPEQMIPVFAVLISVAVNITWSGLGAVQDALLFYTYLGIIQGLATVGLNQIYRQVKQYIAIKKRKKNKDRRHRNRIVS